MLRLELGPELVHLSARGQLTSAPGGLAQLALRGRGGQLDLLVNGTRRAHLDAPEFPEVGLCEENRSVFISSAPRQSVR